MHEHSVNAPDAYGFYPFWFWNGELTEDEIRWQVAEMAAKGIRGFYIHPRQGLRQPYLSDAFFGMVGAALDSAEEQGLLVNLYDEYPYPSGVAGGKVVLGDPQFHATQLVHDRFDVPGGPVRRALPRGKVLCCLAYPLANGEVDWSRRVDLGNAVGMVLADNSYNETGLTTYNRKRYFASNPTPTLETDALQGPHRVYVVVQAVVDHHKYWGHYVDVLNPRAIARFIELTHERYRERCGDRFVRTIRAIFVDETAPGWSSRLPKAFRREYGYDLVPLLPALREPAHPQHLQVARDLARLTYSLFCDSFEEQIAAWCHTNGLRYAGEKPSLRLSQLAYMDIPGCEPGHTKAGAPMDLLRPRIRQNARATASAAYFYGKEGSLCECFHSLGWSGTLQDAKLISEGLLLMGVRYLVPHGFFYTTHALAKHDAPPTFFFQMPYWPLFGTLSERIEAIGQRFEGTHMDARILVVDPNGGLPTPADLQDYERLLAALMDEHLDYLIVDTDILRSGTVGGGAVHIRDVSAEVIVLPPMRVVEEPLQDWLAAFERSGGQVVRLPQGFDSDAHMRLLLEWAGPSLRMACRSGDASRLQMVKRTDGERTVWFLLNTGEDALDVTFTADSALQEVPLDDGSPPLLRRTPHGYRRVVAPFESLLLETAAMDQEKGSEPEPLPMISIPVRQPARVTPLNPNLLRMGEWEMTLLDASGAALQVATVTPKPLPNQLADGGFRFAPTLRTFFGSVPELDLPTIHAEYAFRFENRFPGRIELVMEPGSIVGDWRITVNDGPALTAKGFRETDAHVRGSLGVDITDDIHRGANIVRVSLTTDRIDGGLVNPLYLAGEFSVRLEPVVLEEYDPSGAYEEWEENGLPYYAGVVEYETTFDLEHVPSEERVLVELDHGVAFQDAVKISVNASPWLAMPWSPYRAVLASEYLRTGRNALTIRVHTTLIRSFEGQWFDIAAHCYREVGSGELVPDANGRQG